MIRVEQAGEPPSFDEECRQPGKTWLAERPDGDPHKNPLWSEFRLGLRNSFHARCGFLGHWIHRGTVDHWELPGPLQTLIQGVSSPP